MVHGKSMCLMCETSESLVERVTLKNHRIVSRFQIKKNEEERTLFNRVSIILN